MFGWSVGIVSSPTRLVITDPIPLMALIWACLFTVGPLIYLLVQRTVAVRRVLFLAAVMVVVFAFVLDGARVTLDRAAGTMQTSRFALYHWSTQTVPLTTLNHAYLTTGATTARITLQMQDGSTTSISGNNQMGGKPEAVLAINNFVGVAH